jgi:hypothetical protein
MLFQGLARLPSLAMCGYRVGKLDTVDIVKTINYAKIF